MAKKPVKKTTAKKTNSKTEALKKATAKPTAAKSVSKPAPKKAAVKVAPKAAPKKTTKPTAKKPAAKPAAKIAAKKPVTKATAVAAKPAASNVSAPAAKPVKAASQNVSHHDSFLWNEDLAPIPPAKRTWSWPNYAALWVSMVVCVPTYMLAAGLMKEGMSWSEAIMTVFFGNLIVLFPMLLIGHAGAKYGIPFPVLLRSSFGTRGAILPAMMRAFVACGWFGIQTWIGGSAIYTVINLLMNNVLAGIPLPVIGIDPGQLSCFMLFWAMQVYFIAKGTESIKSLEAVSAPFLLIMGGVLIYWAYSVAGGWEHLLSGPSQFDVGGAKEGQFWQVFWPSLTAMVGFWATLTLNIPDFTRYSKSQKDQVVGQSIGLPIPMAMFAFVGVAAASASQIVYGEAIWDPVVLAGKFGGWTTIIGLITLVIATLNMNIAANVVASSNDFSNLNPKKISFKQGGYITAGLGIAIMPWKLLATSGDYIFVWLVGYSSLLGPIAGILIADYFFIRKQKLDVDELFNERGKYVYQNGWNPAAVWAFVFAVLPNIPGFLKVSGFVEGIEPFWVEIYGYAWFVGAFVAAIIYWLMMPRRV